MTRELGMVKPLAGCWLSGFLKPLFVSVEMGEKGVPHGQRTRNIVHQNQGGSQGGRRNTQASQTLAGSHSSRPRDARDGYLPFGVLNPQIILVLSSGRQRGEGGQRSGFSSRAALNSGGIC
jgi:hypothetical protein